MGVPWPRDTYRYIGIHIYMYPTFKNNHPYLGLAKRNGRRGIEKARRKRTEEAPHQSPQSVACGSRAPSPFPSLPRSNPPRSQTRLGLAREKGEREGGREGTWKIDLQGAPSSVDSYDTASLPSSPPSLPSSLLHPPLCTSTGPSRPPPSLPSSLPSSLQVRTTAPRPPTLWTGSTTS